MNLIDAKKKAQEVLSQMTLEEKASQMLYTSPAISRLNLPEYNWWNEALHGVARAGLSTVFPQSIALSATFNRQALNDVGNVVGEEGRLKNQIYRSEHDRGIYKGLTYWSPNVNIVRDPRWGRGHESYGEDPYLNAEMGTAFVKGIQEYRDENKKGKGLQAAACVKHFAAHSGPEGIRHGFDSVVSKRDLNETYLPAFEKIVKDANAIGIMSSYNAVNGVPTSASSYLLRDLLRDQWGFEGYTVSDCGAIADIYKNHHYTDTAAEAAAAAVKGGCNLNCGNAYAHVMEAVSKGLLEEKDLDDALMHLLTVRFMLDMDDDSSIDAPAVIKEWIEKQKAWKNLNESIAKECIVLLKNNGILPLKEAPRTIAIIGPDARNINVLDGNYHGTASEMVTVAKGLTNQYPSADFLICDGSHLYKDRIEGCSPEADDRLAEAAAYARYADVTFAVIGLDPTIEGEAGDASNEYGAGDKRDVHLPVTQQHLLKTLCEASDNVVVILMSGGALELGEMQDKVAAIVQGWYPGAEGGTAIAKVIAGEVNPTGRLPLTFYRNEQLTWDFSDYSVEGKTYRFLKDAPMYSFGYGEAYEYLTIDKAWLNKENGSSVSVSVTLSNDKDHAVTMPVEVYVKAEEEGLRTPNFQLVGFDKVCVDAKSSKEITLELDPYWLMVVDEEGIRRPCKGELTFYVADHQPDERSEELCASQGRQKAIVLK